MTETKNALSIITKAGVPNNKIFVGEASYGRSFHMAKDGYQKPMCEFTGSRTKSDAKPGRYTKTGGYLAYAEIMEIRQRGHSVEAFYDQDSKADVMLYNDKGCSALYLENLNFAGSIDWAVDLQQFTSDDFDSIPERPKSGQGCTDGRDKTVDSGDLCEFSCNFGFCPTSLCTCDREGTLRELPSADPDIKGRSEDPADVDLNRLCRFACKYGYCPEDLCTTEPAEEQQHYEEVEDDDTNSGSSFDYRDNKWQNKNKCFIYKDPLDAEASDNLASCRNFCQAEIAETSEEGDITNYGCVGLFPLNKEIPWQRSPFGSGEVVAGECKCNAWFVNYLAETVLEALPIIAQIGCNILMGSLKLILDMGLSFLPGPGKALSAGYDMALTAADTISYIYPKEEDPAGAFQWWIFDILNMVPAGRSRFKPPKNIKKGSGKKGDEGNPRSTTGPRNPQTGGNPKPKPRRCNVTPQQSTRRMGFGKNTLRFLSCDQNNVKQTEDIAVTSMTYAANAKALPVTSLCSSKWSQACFHYSSAVSNNPRWATLTCVPEAASTAYEPAGTATSVWSDEHHESWTDKSHRSYKETCDRDEWPPKYFLNAKSPEMEYGGIDKRGQRVRFNPWRDNRGAGGIWRSLCFKNALDATTDKDLHDLMQKGTKKSTAQAKANHEKTEMEIVVDYRPEFSLRYEHKKPKDDGLWDNVCWPNSIASGDPGFALLSIDEWYDKNKKGPNNQRTKWNYAAKYVKGTNGD